MEDPFIEPVLRENNETYSKNIPECNDLDNEDSGDEEVERGPIIKVKKRMQQLSDSESDSNKSDQGLSQNSTHKSRSKIANNIDSDSESSVHKNDQDLAEDVNENPTKRLKKRIQQFSDSDSDCDKENKENPVLSKPNSSGSEEETNLNNKKSKSRIKVAKGSDNSSSSSDDALKNEQQQLRMKNKQNKLKEKFKSLVTSRLNESQTEKVVNTSNDSEPGNNNDKNADNSEESDAEQASIERIKQNIKEKLSSYKTTICDPDTSDEENYSRTKSMPQKKKERKTTKLTSPKPVRMTAKQAMENMKKIKSESNRMLREKEVTLPYHRPKALSLKDIMSRRRPALTSDGKSLPIKMSEEQLRQYAKSLEERQKEMMELCKSDTDEEAEESELPQLDGIGGNQFVNQEQMYTNEESKESNKDTLESKDNTDMSVEASDNMITNIEGIGEDEPKDNTDKTECDEILDNALVVTNNKSAQSNNAENKAETVNDSMNSNASAEMSLVYNDSIEETNVSTENAVAVCNSEEDNVAADKETKVDVNTETEPDSLLVLHYDTEMTEVNSDNIKVKESEPQPSTSKDTSDIAFDEVCRDNDFSDDDLINMDEIDNILDNVEIQENNGPNYANSPMLINDPYNPNVKPKLTGAPGMVIDLDGTDAVAQKKRTGLELLKERFTYFAKLKTPEEQERQKEKRLKPGAQHSKLKQELEDQIAEQRSVEWAKRLEEEKQQKMEMDAMRGDESDDDIDKIEAKLEENNEIIDEESSESEESEEEIQEVKEKPRERNPMIDDEAEESDVEECEEERENQNEVGEKDENGIDNDADVEENNDESSEDSSEESSESEEETEAPTKKGRILKAFEDSDEDDIVDKETIKEAQTIDKVTEEDTSKVNDNKVSESQLILETQDEDLQLAQRHKSFSGDLFTSQESSAKSDNNANGAIEEPDIGTQTFSILNSNPADITALDIPEKITVISGTQPNDDPSLDAVVGMCSGSFSQNLDSQLPSTGLPVGEKFSVISKTQPNDEANLDVVVGMCSGSFSQNVVPSQFPSETQPIGEDILNLCTGKFYDNQFVSQTNENGAENNHTTQPSKDIQDSQILNLCTGKFYDNQFVSQTNENGAENNHTTQPSKDIQDSQHNENKKPVETKIHEDNNLKSILDELNDPEFEAPKPKKYFVDSSKDLTNTHFKKKFIIDSDDETNDVAEVKQKKKSKKKKLEKRALQISDDEEDEYEEEYENEAEDQDQDLLSEAGEEAERLVEYDSEENEVEIKVHKEKKKRKMAEFFEQEAELSSEDEWAGSGDEDERDLDAMEREAGDDDTFNQAKLQGELGQIHLRDVLDQDKREVRLIQELLFEDGDLGDGHRQRKFRWKDIDGEGEGGAVGNEFADTQEDEMESEEQWRKQRHEREVFLRQMQKQDDPDEDINISTTLIKTNLSTRSSLLTETKISSEDDSPVVLEKKTSKDIPSPKKSFTVFQQSYHGSLLSRGGGALSRLAALAAPLADDGGDNVGARAPTANRNFVFATLSQKDPEPKVTKRKADTNIGTPRLVKKMKTEEKKNPPRSSLLDHLKT